MGNSIPKPPTPLTPEQELEEIRVLLLFKQKRIKYFNAHKEIMLRMYRARTGMKAYEEKEEQVWDCKIAAIRAEAEGLNNRAVELRKKLQ